MGTPSINGMMSVVVEPTSIISAGPAGTALPAQVASGELEAQLDGVMNNEALTQQSGRPMWFDGKKLRFDAPPPMPRPESRR
jgi:hypothetical protein